MNNSFVGYLRQTGARSRVLRVVVARQVKGCFIADLMEDLVERNRKMEIV